MSGIPATSSVKEPDQGRPTGWTPPVVIGLIAGIDNIGSGLAIASLIFAGPLVAGLDTGVGVVLLGSAVLALVVALRSTLPNSVALVQETSVAILAGAIAIMAVQLVGPIEAKIATALAILGASTVITGALFWITGRLRLGGLARFLPFPVVAGFLAGSGWLLVEGALAMLTGEVQTAAAVERFQESPVAVRAAAAVTFALVMTLSLRRFSHPFTAPLILVGAATAFYAILFALGLGVDDARALGHLPAGQSGMGLSLPTPSMLGLVDWTQVLYAMPSILAAAVLSLVGLLLNTSGLELELGRDINADTELRSTGIANLLAGSFGGPSGYVGLSMTLLAQKLGAVDRKAGIATAAFMVVGLVFARPLIAHVPVFLTAGFVLFLGIELLQRWMVASRRQLPLVEWLIVIGILAVVAFVGFVEAIAVGLMVSILLFVYNYSKLPVLRDVSSGADQRSSVDRSPMAMKLLARHGDVIEVVQLQGYLFFGTAERMVNHIRSRLANNEMTPLRYLVLDFRHVSGADSAALSCFLKIRALIETHGIMVFFTHVPTDIAEAFGKSGLDVSGSGRVRIEHDIDHALEQCEENLLLEYADADPDAGLADMLVDLIGPHHRLDDLMAAMEERTLEPQEMLIRGGDDPGDVYFVAKGRVRVQITLANGRKLRLRTMTRGAIVGEIGFYLGEKRTADVVVETPTTVYGLSAAALDSMERDDPELSILVHRIMACNLSEKLAAATRVIGAAQR